MAGVERKRRQISLKSVTTLLTSFASKLIWRCSKKWRDCWHLLVRQHAKVLLTHNFQNTSFRFFQSQYHDSPSLWWLIQGNHRYSIPFTPLHPPPSFILTPHKNSNHIPRPSSSRVTKDEWDTNPGHLRRHMGCLYTCSGVLRDRYN